jgi:hypothetical protein
VLKLKHELAFSVHNHDEAAVTNILMRLDELPVTLHVLQATGLLCTEALSVCFLTRILLKEIGVLVNRLQINTRAMTLVDKWRNAFMPASSSPPSGRGIFLLLLCFVAFMGLFFFFFFSSVKNQHTGMVRGGGADDSNAEPGDDDPSVAATVLRKKAQLLDAGRNGDIRRVQLVLKELSQLDVTVEILHETGIGMLVNSLRGPVSRESQALVRFWKERLGLPNGGDRESKPEKRSPAPVRRPARSISESEPDSGVSPLLSQVVLRATPRKPVAEVVASSVGEDTQGLQDPAQLARARLRKTVPKNDTAPAEKLPVNVVRSPPTVDVLLETPSIADQPTELTENIDDDDNKDDDDEEGEGDGNSEAAAIEPMSKSNVVRLFGAV